MKNPVIVALPIVSPRPLSPRTRPLHKEATLSSRRPFATRASLPSGDTLKPASVRCMQMVGAVMRDDAEAVAWYRKADQGLAQAQAAARANSQQPQ